jgi:hypothetical protein
MGFWQGLQAIANAAIEGAQSHVLNKGVEELLDMDEAAARRDIRDVFSDSDESNPEIDLKIQQNLIAKLEIAARQSTGQRARRAARLAAYARSLADN